jgi:HSP20 family protein
MPGLIRYHQSWPVIDEVQRLVEDSFHSWFQPVQTRAFRPAHPPWMAPEGQWVPRVDVIESNGDIVLRAELPGVDPERDVEVHVEDDRVTIRGQRRQEARTQDERFVRVETSYGSFQRTVPLPVPADRDQVRATYRDGILEVAIPRSGSNERSRRIPIQAQARNGKTAVETGGSSRAAAQPTGSSRRRTSKTS